MLNMVCLYVEVVLVMIYGDVDLYCWKIVCDLLICLV